MIDFIKEVFGLAKDTRGVMKDVRDEKSKTRGTRNRILSEVEFNMDLILDHYLEKQVAVEKIIEKLKTAEFSKAFDDGFDFKKIKKGNITGAIVADQAFLKKYLGYDCEALLQKIKHHLEQIKLLPELYDLKDEKKINVKTRLENLAKRYILFVQFLKAR